MKRKLLLVEDHANTSKAIQLVLEGHGYQVVVACTHKEALQLVQLERFHLAIVDVSLVPGDPDDTQGLDLMREIKSFDPTIVIVINTGYATVEKVKAAMQPDADGVRPAFNVLVKSRYQDYDQELNKAFKLEVKINLDLTINSSKGVSIENLADGIVRKSQKLRGQIVETLVAGELRELLQRLFHNADSVDLVAMSQGYSGAGVVRAIPQYQARGKGKGQPLVLKFGEQEDIERETSNFYDFVNGIIGGDTYPMIQGIRRTRNLAGILYSLIGRGTQSQIVDLNTFYLDNDSSRVNQILTQLFEDTCGPWYSTQRTVVNDLANFYERTLHLSGGKLEDALKDYFPAFVRKPEIQFQELAHSFVNPVYYLSGKTFPGETAVSTTHGDLNGRNILVDQRDQTWLIDFFQTGEGHVFRDFIKLETVIKFELLEHKSLQARYALESLLLDSNTFEPSFDPDTRDWDQDIVKAATVIVHLRRLARRIVSKVDPGVDYFVGLLFHTVNYVKFNDVSEVGRQHALMAAGMLCAFLEQARLGDLEQPFPTASTMGEIKAQRPPISHTEGSTRTIDSETQELESIRSRAQTVDDIIADLEHKWRSGDIDTAQYSRLASSRRRERNELLSKMRTLTTPANAGDLSTHLAQSE